MIGGCRSNHDWSQATRPVQADKNDKECANATYKPRFSDKKLAAWRATCVPVGVYTAGELPAPPPLVTETGTSLSTYFWKDVPLQCPAHELTDESLPHIVCLSFKAG